MFPLHEIVFPTSSGKEDALYLNGFGGAVLGAEGILQLGAGQGFRTDTYFGVFPWNLWQRVAGPIPVSLRLRGQGRCRYSLRTLASEPQNDETLQSGIVDIAGEAFVDIAVGDTLAAGSGNGLHLELTAVVATELSAVTFTTPQPPRRTADLGLVITTFNRADVIHGTIAELERMISRDTETVLGRLSLVVVDNGRDLMPAEFPATTVLPNPNFGGAGGFARGLSHLQGFNAATHCCFMDDDAATEGECLMRVRRMLAYACDPRTAVAGAMLRAEETHRIHEQGAVFEWGRGHRIISRKHGLDLLKRNDLVQTLRPEPVGYGGWWLFAFPIGPNLRYPYPMFVRGDDWLFSYLNDFAIEVMPGVCSWQAGFETKITPTEQYLAIKAFVVAELLLRNPASPAKTLYFFATWILRNLFGFCYDRAALNCEALRDVLEGPAFWGRNTALGSRLATLKPLIRTERLQQLESREAALPFIRTHRPERRSKTLLRFALLNGHIVPLWLARFRTPATVAVPHVEAPQPRWAFLRSRVLYRTADGRAFVAVRDTARFFALFARAAVLLGRLFTSYARLRTSYENSVGEYCTKEWWDRRLEAATGGDPTLP